MTIMDLYNYLSTGSRWHNTLIARLASSNRRTISNPALEDYVGEGRIDRELNLDCLVTNPAHHPSRQGLPLRIAYHEVVQSTWLQVVYKHRCSG
jgi:hypothetical protein